jgi:hypothetical protein
MKKVLIFLCALSFAHSGKAQIGVNVGVSGLKFTGDVGKNNNTNYFADTRMGYNLGVDYRVGKILGVGLNGIYGTLEGTDNNSVSHKNFKSAIFGGELNVYAFFDKLSDTAKEVAPFISVGIGYTRFNPYGDLHDKSGVRYYYWNDGSMRDLPEDPANDPYAIQLKRDYSYETKLTDSAKNYSRGALYLPLNVGVKFQAGFHTSVRFGVNYNLAFSDYLDNYKSGGNDSWLAANVTVNVLMIKKPRDIYEGIDFTALDQADYDGDGIHDDVDKCLGTPKGAQVDGNGCPLDSDDDGVPDYMDKEPQTKRRALVDGYGVTVDVEEIARRQREWDSLSVERSEGFNEMPTLTYLKDIESKSKELKEKSGKTNAIPDELKPADLNNDGYISADEITKTIDSFFDGNPNFNVERINRLIDFFFEQ